MAAEKVRKEKWESDKIREIQVGTVQKLEPTIANIIEKNKEEIRKIEERHQVEIRKAKESAIEDYEKKMD